MTWSRDRDSMHFMRSMRDGFIFRNRGPVTVTVTVTVKVTVTVTVTVKVTVTVTGTRCLNTDGHTLWSRSRSHGHEVFILATDAKGK